MTKRYEIVDRATGNKVADVPPGYHPMVTNLDGLPLYEDHALIRHRMRYCPLCQGDKALGLVLCWPCHHRLKARHNGAYGRKVEMLLDVTEHAIALTAGDGVDYSDKPMEDK